MLIITAIHLIHVQCKLNNPILYNKRSQFKLEAQMTGGRSINVGGRYSRCLLVSDLFELPTQFTPGCFN